MMLLIKKNINWIKSFFIMHNFLKYNKRNGKILFIEHKCIFITGRLDNLSNLILNTNIPIIQCERGGGITYHNIGQQILYILLTLYKKKNFLIKFLIRNIKNLIFNILIKILKIKKKKLKIKNGIFLKKKKIFFYGFKIIKKHSIYGISLNNSIKLLNFKKIKPCGKKNKISKLNILNKKLIKIQIYLIKFLFTNTKIWKYFF